MDYLHDNFWKGSKDHEIVKTLAYPEKLSETNLNPQEIGLIQSLPIISQNYILCRPVIGHFRGKDFAELEKSHFDEEDDEWKENICSYVNWEELWNQQLPLATDWGIVDNFSIGFRKKH